MGREIDWRMKINRCVTYEDQVTLNLVSLTQILVSSPFHLEVTVITVEIS